MTGERLHKYSEYSYVGHYNTLSLLFTEHGIALVIMVTPAPDRNYIYDLEQGLLFT